MHLRLIFLVFALSVAKVSYCQVINWKSSSPKKNMANITVGADYSISTGINYARKVNASTIPMWVNVGIDIPAGAEFLDDFKSRVGIQARLLGVDNFQLAAGLQGIYRRLNNTIVTAKNFGGQASVTGGYYANKWFVAAEVGFDKAAATHLTHSTIYKEDYPGVKDGWYPVPTGGNVNAGLQGGTSIGHSDITFKAGILRTQYIDSDLLLPFYGQLGYTLKF